MTVPSFAALTGAGSTGTTGQQNAFNQFTGMEDIMANNFAFGQAGTGESTMSNFANAGALNTIAQMAGVEQASNQAAQTAVANNKGNQASQGISGLGSLIGGLGAI